MNTQTAIPILKSKTDYEVIGYGPMITKACQIGEWWVMRAEEYTGPVPDEVKLKLQEFLQGTPNIVGLLVAEDIKVIEAQRHQTQKQTDNQRLMETGLGIAWMVLRVIGLGLVWLIGVALSYDPMLIAVLPDGRWLCLASWYD